MIVYDYNPKPIPMWNHDWECWDDDTYDGHGSPIGYGATQEDAYRDLVEEERLKKDRSCAHDGIECEPPCACRCQTCVDSDVEVVEE